MVKGENGVFFQNAHITILVLRRKTGSDMYCSLSTPNYVLVRHHRWHAVRGKDKKTFYAFTNIRRPEGSYTCLQMHRLLRPNVLTDHANRDGLNNQDYNLREATLSQNGANKSMMKNNKSGHRGVMVEQSR